MVLVALIACGLAKQAEGITGSIAVLGSLAIGAQRLLPTLQQAYGSWSSIRGGQIALQETLAQLDQTLPHFANETSVKPIPFERSIVLKSVDFSYGPQIPAVLNQVNLTIAKGGRVGFVGETGSGKSTLLDIIMGLLHPTNGTLEIDGLAVHPGNLHAWQKHIAHVPQAIFLADCSVEENIAFGVPVDQIDPYLVRQAAQKAQISVSVESWPNKYATIVGERGVRLSGGQRQRIGIARALYRRASVIVFDEATSALDTETEQAVMKTIEEINDEITILVIAHRIGTLKECTQIVEIEKGCIKWTGSYKELEMRLGNKKTIT
jgi:ATP-binding cassette subfamily B protein